MAKAFECWNDSGYHQIDSEYPNLRLVQKGSVYCETPIPGDQNASGYIADIAVPGLASVIGYRCVTAPVASTPLSNDGTTYRHRFNTGHAVRDLPQKAWVDWWAFSLNPADVHAGLQIFNQAGQLVFTSQDRPAKVCGNRNMVWDRNQQTQDWQVLDARLLAVVQCSSVFGVAFSGNRQTWSGFFAQMLNANTVRISQAAMTSFFNGPYNGNPMDIGQGSYLFLDVAGQ